MTRRDAQIFHVNEDLSDLALANALRHWLPERSWAQVKKLVTGRQVQVSGNLCLDPGRKLTSRDVVKVFSHPLAPPPSEQDVKVRYLDKHIVIVEKPAGLTSTRHAEEKHWSARRKQLQPTLEELVPRAIALHEGKKMRGDVRLPRVLPVHRLDRDTSGLMVFARTPEAERALVDQFREHEVQRVYVAVAHGSVAAQTIENFIVRDRGDGKRGSGSKKKGQSATTHVRPKESLGNYTMIECRLETGRTHQIRIHLSECGHMLCGEKMYTHELGQKPRADKSGAPRLALHSSELALVHPVTGKTLRFEMPLPKDLAAFVKRLRSETSRSEA